MSHDPTNAQMFEVIPNIFISRFPEKIDHRITHAVNMCNTPSSLDPSRVYLHIPISDIDNITPRIPTITTFIDKAFEQPGGKVLVHCSLGINRSASAVIAYLCNRDGISASDALELLKAKKADVQPPFLFLNQIDRFFGRPGEREDPLKEFHRRLEQRKKQDLK